MTGKFLEPFPERIERSPATEPPHMTSTDARRIGAR
jgi:hypothetical protein